MALRSRTSRNDPRNIFEKKKRPATTNTKLHIFDVHRSRGPPPKPPKEENLRHETSQADDVISSTSNDSVAWDEERDPENVNETTTSVRRDETEHVDETRGEDVEKVVTHTIEFEDNAKQASSSTTVSSQNGTESQEVVPGARDDENTFIITTNVIEAVDPIANTLSLDQDKPSNIFTTEITVDSDVSAPPSVPPRKRSNNKQPFTLNTNVVKIGSPVSVIESQNKTIVKISSPGEDNAGGSMIHKLKIKNDFPEFPVNSVSITDSKRGKTSILINGDDCYCTVNVNDDVPLYQSSVIVKDAGVAVETNARKFSSVYITTDMTREDGAVQSSVSTNKEVAVQVNGEETSVKEDVRQKEKSGEQRLKCVSNEDETNDEEIARTSQMISEILRNPVEAVKRNLVPHVCGKTDALRKPRSVKKKHVDDLMAAFLDDCPLDSETALNPVSQLIEESFLKLRRHDGQVDEDGCSEHSSSTQYETMEAGSDCYTDNSNRSSVTEEELSTRSKFYELLAASAVEVAESDDHHYECIRPNSDPIYEEIEIPPPLPANPPPMNLLDDLQLDKEYTTRYIYV